MTVLDTPRTSLFDLSRRFHVGEWFAAGPHVSAGPQKPSRTRRYEMLDVWRGLICLLVVLEHVGVVLWPEVGDAKDWSTTIHLWVNWCLSLNFGTPLFFVISGYCIAASVESAVRKGQGPSSFLGRRLWRIYPTYWAALLLFVAVVAGLDAFGLVRLHESEVSLAVASPGTVTWPQWLGNLTLTETWRPWLGGGGSNVYTRVAWSLCYPEQFYLVCFVAMWLAPNRILPFLFKLTAVVLLWRVVLWDSGRLHVLEGTFPYYWHEFAVGLAVYWRLNANPTPQAARALNACLAALAALGFWFGDRPTLAAAAFGLVLIGLHRWDARAGRAAWLEPLRACGRRSFSIYLTHLPLVMVANVVLFDLGLTSFAARILVIVPVVTVASVAFGFAFYAVVEKRFTGAPALFGLGLAGRVPAAAPAAPQAA
ncbi:MAG: acyltransferase [Isosphaeraceae bacterium]